MSALQDEEVVTLSPAAQKKVLELLEREGRDDLALRVAVQPGGCSGLIYELYFDERILEGDLIHEYPTGVRTIIDKLSEPYLRGAKVDFPDTLMSSGFTLDNPNAEGSCACGGSFS